VAGHQRESDFAIWSRIALEPTQGKKHVSYQLLRNVLAAHSLNFQFCVLLDSRRPDLLECWYQVMRCIRPTALRTRCKVLTWQELAGCQPTALQRFLDLNTESCHGLSVERMAMVEYLGRN
jgi:hypothetical protein